MAKNRVLNLSRIDVFPARNDHVLYPVMNIDIAVIIHITGIARPQPTLVVQGLGCGLGQVPVTGHIGDRAAGNLADHTGRDHLACFIQDHDLDPGQGLASRAHTGRALWHMVFGRQGDNGA